MKIIVGSYTVDIRLDKGIYIFDPDSGTGKSYLATVLRSYALMHDDVLVMSYSDFDLERLQKSTASLIVLDRAELYVSKDFKPVVNGLDALVLIDLKSANLADGLESGECSIEFTDSGDFIIENTLYI